MMSSRLEPMSTTLMIDHRVYIHSPITGVMCGLHARCGSCDSAVYSFLEPGPTRGPATAGLTAGAMKPLSGWAVAAATTRLGQRTWHGTFTGDKTTSST